MSHVSVRYLPFRLTPHDTKQQWKELQKSRSLYKQGKYYTRKKVASYSHHPSKHIVNAKRMYHVNTIGATDELAKATGCSKDALAKIINKGQGAYFSSGSRPNQTGHSWGIARLASSITAGKASAVDYDILEQGCHAKTSKALRLAKQARLKYGRHWGTKRVPQRRRFMR